MFDAEELAAVESHAEEGGVRLIAVAVSVMTRLAHELVGEPLRAVFPVHSAMSRAGTTRWDGSSPTPSSNPQTPAMKPATPL